MRQTSRLLLSLSITLLCTAYAQPIQPEPEPTPSELMRKLEIPEANQGIAVDAKHFYAIDNKTIAKYDKGTAERVAVWEGAEDGPFLHLDSGVVLDGLLYAAHSNYSGLPMTSSVEVWDVATMKHVDTHSFGIDWGSFTWLDRHDGFWWAGFANYNRVFGNNQAAYGNKYWTTVVKLNDDWQRLEAWTLPEGILERFEDMSNSGGSWGPDGRLYLTGHDPAEAYVMTLPEAGSVLKWVGTVELEIAGQGIAWDRSRPDVLYGIIRGEDDEPNRVSVSRVDVTRQVAGER